MTTKSLSGTPWEVVKMLVANETESVTPSLSCVSSTMQLKLEERQRDAVLLLSAHVAL